MIDDQLGLPEDSNHARARPDNLPVAHGPSILPALVPEDLRDPAVLPEHALDLGSVPDLALLALAVLAARDQAVELLRRQAKQRAQAVRLKDADVADLSSTRKPRKAR